jgi:hypothetical protein
VGGGEVSVQGPGSLAPVHRGWSPVTGHRLPLAFKFLLLCSFTGLTQSNLASVQPLPDEMLSLRLPPVSHMTWSTSAARRS